MSRLMFLLFAFPLPLLTGYPIARKQRREDELLLSSWVFGWLFLCASIYFPALAGIFLQRSLKELILVWGFFVGLQAIFALYCMKTDRWTPFSGFKKMLRGITLTEVIAIVLVLIHAAVTFHYMHLDNDDIAYIGAVTTSVDTNTLMKYDAVTGNLIVDLAKNDMNRLVTAPLFAFYAAISKITRLRPAPLCHTWLPPVLTMLFFAAFALIGKALYPDRRRKSGLFVIAVWILSAFSYVSVYTSGTFLMIRSWQGKAQVVGLILPMLLYIYMKAAEKQKMEMRDFWLVVLVLTAACLMTTMGAMLAAILTAILCVLSAFLIKSRKPVLLTLPAMIVPGAVLVLYMLL